MFFLLWLGLLVTKSNGDTFQLDQCLRVTLPGEAPVDMSSDFVHQLIVKAAQEYIFTSVQDLNIDYSQAYIFPGWGVSRDADVPPDSSTLTPPVQIDAANRGNSIAALGKSPAGASNLGTVQVPQVPDLTIRNPRINADTPAGTEINPEGSLRETLSALKPTKYEQFIKLALYGYPLPAEPLTVGRDMIADYFVMNEDPVNFYFSPRRVATDYFPVAFKSTRDIDEVFPEPITDFSYRAMYAGAVARKGGPLTAMDVIKVWYGASDSNPSLGQEMLAMTVAETRRNWVNSIITPMLVYLLQNNDSEYTWNNTFGGIEHSLGGLHPMATGGTFVAMNLFQEAIFTPGAPDDAPINMDAQWFRLPWQGGWLGGVGAKNLVVKTYQLEIQAAAHFWRLFNNQLNVVGQTVVFQTTGCNPPPVLNLGDPVPKFLLNLISVFMMLLPDSIGTGPIPPPNPPVPYDPVSGQSPPVITNIQIGPPLLPSQILLSYTGVADMSISSYSIVIEPGNFVVPAAESPVLLTGLIPGRVYKLYVQANYVSGQNLRSSLATARPVGVPSAPSLRPIAAGDLISNGGLFLKLIARVLPANNNGDPIFRFQVTCTDAASGDVQIGNGGSEQGIGGQTEITLAEMNPSTTYNCIASAFNEIGESPNSPMQTVVTPEAPPMPVFSTTPTVNRVGKQLLFAIAFKLNPVPKAQFICNGIFTNSTGGIVQRGSQNGNNINLVFTADPGVVNLECYIIRANIRSRSLLARFELSLPAVSS